jgi:hypothetical protein
MTDTWSEAHHHLDRVLTFLLVVDVVGAFVGVIRHDGWFTTVWLVAGLIAGVIETPVNQSVTAIRPPEDDEFANEKELAEAYAFARKFMEASNLLAATALAVGFILGNPWWSNLLVAIFAWLIGLFGIPPREIIVRATPREVPVTAARSSPRDSSGATPDRSPCGGRSRRLPATA